MLNLSLAALAFLAIHLASSSPLRGALIARFGWNAWTIAFSLVSVIAIVWLVMAYAAMPEQAPIFLPSPIARWIANILMPLAFLFFDDGPASG